MSQTIDKLHSGYMLIQDDRFFKLGQDSVLLADFSTPNNRAKICDLGCGNGALSVLLCAKNDTYDVTGLELQPEVAQLAIKNAEINHISERFHVINGDITNIKSIFNHSSFDYVITNPPYFSDNSGFETENKYKKIARNEKNCTLDDIMFASSYILKFGGKFSIVHKPERMVDIICSMREYNLEPKKIRFIHKNLVSSPSALLVEGKKGAKSGISVLPPLIIHNEDGSKTEEYKKIYHL